MCVCVCVCVCNLYIALTLTSHSFTPLYRHGIVYGRKEVQLENFPTSGSDKEKDHSSEDQWRETFFHLERKQCDALADTIAALGRSQVGRWEWLENCLTSLRGENEAANQDMSSNKIGLHSLKGFDLEQRIDFLESAYVCVCVCV